MIIMGPVAFSDNYVIGIKNDLPWHLPEDLRHFKEVTMGKTVLMGRNTYDSIFNRLGKPLPGRKSIVVSRQIDFIPPEGVTVFDNLDKALTSTSEDIYIIGGGEIFRQTLPLAKKMYATHVYGNFEGDAFFPEVNWDEWKKVEEENHDSFSFSLYDRKN